MTLARISELAAATSGRTSGVDDASAGFERIETDSRKVRRGDVFWALKGPQHDGHNYIEQANQRERRAVRRRTRPDSPRSAGRRGRGQPAGPVGFRRLASPPARHTADWSDRQRRENNRQEHAVCDSGRTVSRHPESGKLQQPLGSAAQPARHSAGPRVRGDRVRELRRSARSPGLRRWLSRKSES